MKIIIDKESIENVFAIALYSIIGGDYTNIKETTKEILDKIEYTPYDPIAADHTSGDSQTSDKWIPITMRPIEEDEKFVFPDATFIFDCPMPENGQQILISTKYGVDLDTCFTDDGCYLDSDRDWEEVYAWQPLPEPYKKEGKEE